VQQRSSRHKGVRAPRYVGQGRFNARKRGVRDEPTPPGAAEEFGQQSSFWPVVGQVSDLPYDLSK